MHRRLFGVALVVIVSLAVPIAVWAARGDGRSTVDTQSYSWSTDPASTESQSWTRVDTLRPLVAACARGGATATVGLQLAPDSAPAEVRVVMDDISTVCQGDECGTNPRMRPGAVTFESRTTTFGFSTRSVPGTHGSALRVQWRSPTGGAVKLEKAAFSALWNAPPSCL
jgi:hypothetical protein